MAASISQLTWNTKLAGHELHAAGGETDVLIIASGENPQGLQQSADIISRRKVKLTDDDRRRLSSQGIAEECQGDDADIMKARYTLDKESTVVKVERDQVENCGKKLTKNYILKQIEVLMKCSNKARSKCVS